MANAAWIGLNLAVRLSILYFLVEVLLLPDDPRFAGKAIGTRNLVIVLTCSLLFPLLHPFWKGKPWRRYPFGLDSLYLSIFWLDMAGNSFNLYDSYERFDLIPHFHGPGAMAVVFRLAFQTSPLGAIGRVSIIHTLLEAQEAYTDMLAGTHNVRGVADVVNDLTAGVLGSGCYIAVAALLRRRHKA